MRTLGALGPRSFRRNAGRYVLTAIGIALGVGVLFGILLANESVTHALERELAPAPSGRVLVQTAGTVGGDIPHETAVRASHLAGVARVDAGLGFLAPIHEGKDRIYVFAFDTFKGPAPLPAQPKTDANLIGRLQGREPRDGADEVTLGGQEIARLLKTRLGASVTLLTPAGPRPFLVAGVWVYPKADIRNGIRSSRQALQRAMGKGDVVTSLSIQLGRGVDTNEWLARHGDDLGPDLRMSGGGQGLADLRTLFRTVRGSFAALAGVAMFVGGFLVFLTLSMAVIERTRMYGTLRALGATRGQVLRVVIGEALSLGVVSTAVGILLGFGVGAAFLSLTARIYGIRQPRFAVPPAAFVEAVVVGVVVTVAASLVPAVRASRLSPVEAIRGSYNEDRRLPRTWAAGAALLVTGVAIALQGGRWLSDSASPVILLGAVLLVPLVTRPVARMAGGLTRRIAPGLGDIGVMHLVKERSRSAYTLALVMVVLALVLAVGGVQRSYAATQEDALTRSYPADLAVSGGQPVDAVFTARVRATKGVQAATELRFGEANVTGRGATAVLLTVIDPASFFAVQPVPWVHGTDATARQKMLRGDAVLLPEGLARRFGAGLGGHISMATSAGSRRFEVAGIYPTNDSQRRITVGLPDAKRYFKAGPAFTVAVRVARGADVTTVGEAIETQFRDHGGAFVRPTSEDKARTRKGFNDYFNLLYAVLFVAGAMGLLGLGNTLAMSVVRRTREIGVLRAIGAHRTQVRLLVLVESATLALVALVLAVPLGWLLSATILRASYNTLGVVIAYRQPWALLPVVAVLAVLSAALAAIAPARRASRVEPVTALRFE